MDGPNKMTTSDSPVSRLVICNYGLWLMWFCVTKIFMWSTFNQTGLVLAVVVMAWMMWAALGKNLTSLVAHTVYLATAVLYGNLWEFNAVSMYKHIILQFVCFHELMQSKGCERYGNRCLWELAYTGHILRKIGLTVCCAITTYYMLTYYML